MSPKIHFPNFPALFKNHPDAIAAAICALFVLLGWLALNAGWIGLALLILPIAYVVGGFESARDGLTTLWKERELDVDLLMIVAALSAATLRLWQRDYYQIIDGAVLILIFAVSGALEGYAMQRTERSIRGLMSLTSDTARVMRLGIEQIVPISELKIGDLVILKPGELVPTDGLVIEGFSTLNQASITGESMPVEKTVGDEVFAGTINGYGALRIEIHQPPESSLIQRVIRLVEQAQTERPPSQQLIERFERSYAKAIVIVGVLLATLPPFVLGWDWSITIYRALIFLVVASPCALMAAIMPTLLSGIANGARQGILFKSGATLELMGRVKAIAFDKTGTLTIGKPKVVQIVTAETSEISEEILLEVAAALESLSEHPIGIAIVQAAKEKGLQWSEGLNVQAHAGQGITGEIENRIAVVGNGTFVQKLMKSDAIELEQHCYKLEKEGKTVIWVGYDGSVLGIIAVADTVRAGASQAISHLRHLGIRQIVMLTGDNQRTADSIAQNLGIDLVYADLLPEDKVYVVQQLQKQYQTVAMVGDGINDAPALAQASVGIAMGVTGSDVALETADVVLMADRLEKLASAIELGRRSQVIVKQNIIFALSFLAVLVIANFVGGITLPIGVIGHEGSTVLVTLSGLRLLRNR
ncbi:heavy metal translocating P-type ATPase [Pseudanabaena sp. ABRG5-3]|uniref:heavy metal translocating P-type ATPase n=1 Tax=Pseudanabaena sp. ABRG5-3 TaxID=685565 RepID=UPI000DC6FCE9|nr:heavy metal translocating P-type ATPase [Pseudanabaena sp. ABRG5-3]BBC26732.1 cadmium-translocating P-type ATPase [Pseudanabaena sp. ABRG5-3]